MTERARLCLVGESRRATAVPRIAVTPPADHDEAMLRDGIPFHAAERVGNRAGWLREVLARTPLSTWTEMFGASPAEITAMDVTDAGADDVRHDKDVHLGWARAAVRQRDQDWARALLERDTLLGEIDALAALLGLLPQGERDTTAAGLFQRLAGPMERTVLVGGVDGPWGGDLADTVIGALTYDDDQPDMVRFAVSLCHLAEERLTPEAATRVEEAARLHRASGPLAELAEILRFRHDMLEELRAVTA